MTRPTTTGKAQDLITFTRSTTGTALAKISYGEELVTNGTFDDGTTGWTAGDAESLLSIVSNSLRLTNNDAGTAYVYSSYFTTVVGKDYTISFNVSGTSDTAKRARLLVIGQSEGTLYDSSNVYSVQKVVQTFTANDTSTRLILSNGNLTGVGAYFDFDNVTVKEVLYDQPDGTIQLFNHPINKPRIEYDASGNCLGLLVEEARTNQATHSEDLTVSAWGLMPNSFRNSTNSIAPDGTAGATRFYTNSNVPAFLQQICPGSVGAKTHIVSCWARSTNGGADQTFRLKNTHAAVTDFYSDNKTATSEWQRFIFTTTFISASNTAVIAGIVEDSSANQFDIEVWGMQVEFDTSFPTSYIPTSGSAVTRAADIASLAVSEFGYNQDQGTFVAQATSFYLGTNRETVISTVDSSSNLGVFVGKTAGGGDIDALYAGEGGSNTYFSLGAITEDTSYKFAFAIKTDDFAGSKDGDAVVTDTSGTQRTSITDLGIGSRKNASNRLNGHIKSIQYYPLRLSNAQLQALTV